MEYHIIGSRAFEMYKIENPKLRERCSATADWDILIHSTENPKLVIGDLRKIYGNKIEIHQCDILFDEMSAGPDRGRLLDILFTLKASHVMFHRHHKDKTFYDIAMFSEAGCRIDEHLFLKLHNFWIEKYGIPWRADFTKESSDFFNDAVSREHQHDELHETVAILGKPAFKFLQEPGQTTVWVDPIKFNQSGDYVRKRVVIEEAQVLALERDIIPGRCKDPHLSYMNKVKDLIDRLAPLWMVPFICNNLNYFLNFKDNYHDKIKF